LVTRITDLRTEGDYRVLDDRMLVLDFQAGQPQAFVEIHRRYGPLAKHVCTRFLPNRHDADEAFQETMIRVFQGLHRFNGQYALQPWVARIATNVSLDQIRARARRPQVEDGTIEDHEHRDPAAGPDEIIERLVERDLVLSVLAGLPPTHRTALVLRELEGRSHREIAETLDITPAQAKALIHRAKGSFRRSWLLAVTEKGGLAGIALIPLLWLIKAADGVRRVADKVGGHAAQVAQAATPEIVTSAASSPATVNAATSMTERVVAAGMALVVAGGVTVGAVSVVKNRADRDQGERAEAPAVVAAPPVTASPEPEAAGTTAGPAEPAANERRADRDRNAEPPVVVTDPAGETSPSPSPETSPTPSPSPSGDPSPQPPPGPPPAPAWAFGLRYIGPTVAPCACTAETTLESSSMEGDLRAEVTLRQAVKGAVADTNGHPLWPYYLEFEGTAGRTEGALVFKLVISPDGASPYWYDGEGFLSSATRGEHGSMTYSFVGGYQLRPDQEALGVPVQGRFSARVGVWPDGTIYLGSFTLLEA
jgi:RNA polymerase sigma-70 factor (ECF subfamily)